MHYLFKSHFSCRTFTESATNTLLDYGIRGIRATTKERPYKMGEKYHYENKGGGEKYKFWENIYPCYINKPTHQKCPLDRTATVSLLPVGTLAGHSF